MDEDHILFFLPPLLPSLPPSLPIGFSFSSTSASFRPAKPIISCVGASHNHSLTKCFSAVTTGAHLDGGREGGLISQDKLCSSFI